MNNCIIIFADYLNVFFFQLQSLESILGGLKPVSRMFGDSGGTNGENKKGNGPNSAAHGKA